MKITKSFLASSIQLIICVLMISTGKMESGYMMILYLNFILRFPFILSRMREEKIKLFQFISIMVSSILTILIFIFILGAFSIRKWILFSIFIGPVTLIPIYLDGWNYDIYLSLIGLLFGSILFPLDWQVYWKTPPISHIIFFTAFSFIGSYIDMLH